MRSVIHRKYLGEDNLSLMELRILSVNVSKPKIIALANGEPVLSGIAKRPLGIANVFVSALNIDGDGQADLSVHGGFDKAVYAYSAADWPWWEREHSIACAPGTFGENLTLDGVDDSQIAIGDRFVWGECELEVAQPRSPCFKFNIHTRREDAALLMTQSGRCGFYLRVTREGHAPVDGAELHHSFASHGPSVRETFLAAHDPQFSQARRAEIMRAPRLADSWRFSLAKRLRSAPN
jgi:MOSC domain-containing protein YiiM